jgi:hypothetical protein
MPVRLLSRARATLALLVACAVVACALGGSVARVARIARIAQASTIAVARPTTHGSHAARIDALAAAPTKARAGAATRAPFEPAPALVAPLVPRVAPAVLTGLLARVERAPASADAHPHLARARGPPRPATI